MKTLLKIGAGMLLLAVVLTTGLYGILKAQGSSHRYTEQERAETTENRPLTAAVTSIELTGPIDLIVKQGATPSITINAEQRLLSKVSTEIEGNTLRINTKGILLHMKHPLQVEVTLAALQRLSTSSSGDTEVNGFSGDKVDLSLQGSGSVTFNGQYKNIIAKMRGSGDFNLDGGNSDNVEIELFGSGDFNANGKAKTVNIALTGSGDINAEQLTADTVKVTLQGSGNVSAFAKQSVDLNVLGSGDISIDGNPTQRVINRHGSGDVSFN